MSRQKSNGLGYFPLDVDFFEKDKRIRRLIGRFNSDGALFYIYLLCKIYEHSYYIVCDDDFMDDAAVDLRCTKEKIMLMLDYLLNKSLLDRKLYDTVKVLTSHGIQKQYQASCKAMKRTAVDIDEKLWILSNDETSEFIKVRSADDNSEKKADNSGNNHDNSEKKSTKESKGNKRKQNDSERNKKAETHEAIAPLPSSVLTVNTVCDMYNDICTMLPPCLGIPKARGECVQQLIDNGYTIDSFRALFEKVKSTKFLIGNNPKGWKADFDWIIKNSIFILEGKYDPYTPYRNEKTFDIDEFEMFTLTGSTGNKTEAKPMIGESE